MPAETVNASEPVRTNLSRKWWAGFAVFVLLFLLMFQSIWFVGTTTLRDYERLQKELQQVQDEKARISAAGAVANEVSASSKSLIVPLEKKLDGLIPQMGAAVSSIKIWNRMWRWMIFWSNDASDESSPEEDNAELRSANGATQVLGLYILPLFYGWLGALLWVLQKLREDDSDTAVDRLKPGSRVVTGMVAGPMIGMFLSPEFLNSLAFQAAPFALAFLGGYSTDVFFAIIDRFLRIFRDALEKPSDQARDTGGPRSTAVSAESARSTAPASPAAPPGSTSPQRP